MGGAWCPKPMISQFSYEYLQVDLGKLAVITMVEIQGRFGNGQVTLRLHYVPGDHGSHGSPKRSAPCDLVNFCLGTQVLLSIITFRHGPSRYP